MFRFEDPYYFLLLIPVGTAAWFVYRRRVRSALLFAPMSRIPWRGSSWRIRVARLLPVLYIAGLSLAVVAAARPQTLFSKVQRSTDAIAIQMVLDCSGSMEALDMSEQSALGIKEKTRLDAVKEAFEVFVKRRPDDLLGLITFGGFASSRVPLTADHNALMHVLRGVEIPKSGLGPGGQLVTQEEMLTAIGDALATGCARLEHTKLKSRIIVLLSDGESNAGVIRPEDALKVARKMGIKVYTIGVGSTGMAPVRLRDNMGRVAVRQVNVTLDDVFLKKAAEQTGAKYFHVKDPEGLEKALTDINKLEKTKVDKEVYEQFSELFGWFLFPAMALIVLGAGINVIVARRVI